MRTRKIFLLMLVPAVISFAQSQSNRIYEMTNKQIDSLLIEISKKNLTVTEKMNFYSEMFLGMPYDLTCAGEGPYALYETEPLVNFDSTNCMVYCEHVLALSISDSWDNFFNNLQQIRYKEGIIGMRTRNHYTMADWLPGNNWLLCDVTAKIGGNNTKQVTRTISHEKFFKGKGISDLRYVKADRKITIDYISFEDVLKVKDNIKTGDIFALIFANKDDIFSAHMMMVMEKEGKKVVRESALTPGTTLETEFDEWIKKFIGSKTRIGVSFMRVKDELNIPGKIVLPWEIHNLKILTQ